ncbi:MAG: redoxin domain-containing protein [Methylococcales bacterium]|nr:redoxin domain-containing protein [Methylococcales bacterium]
MKQYYYKNESNNKGCYLSSFLLIGLLFFTAVANAAIKVGGKAPAFRLSSASGSVWSEKRLVRAPMSVIYFFRPSRCKVCAKGLKSLQDAAKGIGQKDMVVVGIGRGKAVEINNFAKKHGIKFPMLATQKAIIKKMGVNIYPTMVVIGPDKKVINVVKGGSKKANSTEKMMFALAERYLQRKQYGSAGALFAKLSKKDKTGKAKAGAAYSLLKNGKLASAETSFSKMSRSSNKATKLKGQEGLAEVYLQQGKTEKALALADSILKAGNTGSVALLTKGKALHQKGNKKEAAKYIRRAAKSKKSDFSWQKAEAQYAQGNLQRKNKKAKIALVSYEKAVASDPYFVEAMSNQGVALQDLGNPEKALNIFKKIKKIDPKDRLVYSLMRQAQAAMAQKQDIERQKYIDGLVGDLLKQYKENKKKPKNADEWTSPVFTVSILGFKSEKNPLMGRAGLEGVLQEELTRELQARNIKVVERAVIEKILSELKLGASSLTDKDASLKLGKIMAARVIATGSTYAIGKKQHITLRMLDTESTNIVASLADQTRRMDPSKVAKKFANEIARVAKEEYPLKGRIVLAEEETIIINVGKKHGVTKGQVFNVLGEGKPLNIRGRIIKRTKKLGKLQVTEVEDDLAYAKVKVKKGSWGENQKIKESISK